MSQANTIEISIRTCPDCATEAAAFYCPQCGEEMEPTLPTVKHYFQELLGEFLALDSKLVRTIPAFLFRPGFLTTEYIEGRRQRYLRPSRVYLLVAIPMFFFVGMRMHEKKEHQIGRAHV